MDATPDLTTSSPSRRTVLLSSAGLFGGLALAGAPTSQAATTVTRWVKPPYTNVYSTASTSSLWSRLGEAVPVTGYWYNSGWFKVTAGAMAGKFVPFANLTATNPASQSFAYPSSDPFALPAAGTSVTRYVISGDFWCATRTAPSFSASTTTAVAPRSEVTGTVVSADWVKLGTSRYISTTLLATTPTIRSFNGRIPASRLKALPSYTNTSVPGARYLSRVAANQFIAMDSAFYKAFGYHLTTQEGYRSMYWQQHWYSVYGAPRAAYPGTSNHGSGLAIDLRADSTSPFRWGTSARAWLTANAGRFGFNNPWWLAADRGNPEYWHYNFVG